MLFNEPLLVNLYWRLDICLFMSLFIDHLEGFKCCNWLKLFAPFIVLELPNSVFCIMSLQVHILVYWNRSDSLHRLLFWLCRSCNTEWMLLDLCIQITEMFFFELILLIRKKQDIYVIAYPLKNNYNAAVVCTIPMHTIIMHHGMP